MKTRLKRLLKYKELFLLTLPGIILLFIFSYIPMFLGFILPFKNVQYDVGILASPSAGLDNFKFLFNSDAAWRITRNTVGLNFLFIITVLTMSIICALMLFELSKKSVKIYQTIFFVPYFISWVVASYICLAMLDMDHGLFNSILAFFGREPILWYNESSYWPVIMVVANAWKNIGYYTIIFYTGLLGINTEYYEAARMDGASRIQQIRYITLPALKGLIIMMFLIQLSKIFSGNFDMFYNLPRNSAALYPTTDVIDTYVYRSLKVMGDIGMSAAAGLYQSVVGFVIVITTNFIIRKADKDSAMF